eukprot:gene5687-6271_t
MNSNKSHDDDAYFGAIVPYSLYNPFANTLSLPERLFSIHGSTIRLAQRYCSDGKGGTELGFGASVYNCSIVLSKYLEQIGEQVQGKAVLEIGCGPALVSVTAACLGAAAVVATDGDELSVSLAAENLQNNRAAYDATLSSCQAVRLLWADEGDISRASGLFASYDGPHWVVASDVVAVPYETSYSDLISTLVSLCRPQTTLLLCYQRRHSSEQSFFHALEKYFQIERLPRQQSIHSDFLNLPIWIYSCKLRP